jgi:NADPH-dependent 2,4-dienoyl-CoA reductase/sulfur reductase-like enzyme
MGNIGNENAVRRTDILNARTIPGRETRISKDLFGSPHKQGYMDEINMIRRAAGKIPHVCVVGAGVAGLRCVDLLLKQGVKVTVLEGRNRVGGRVCLPSFVISCMLMVRQLCQSNALGHLVDL